MNIFPRHDNPATDINTADFNLSLGFILMILILFMVCEIRVISEKLDITQSLYLTHIFMAAIIFLEF